MAKKAKGSSTSAAEGSTSTRKAGKVRTDSDLMSGSIKDKVFLVIRRAYGLAKQKGFEGVSALETVKFPGGAFYAKFKPGGPYQKLTSDSEQFEKIASLARSAKGDIAGGNFSSDVKGLLNAAFAVGGEGRGARDNSILNDLDF